ncbi:MAG: oligoendopeptidase F family protein [Bacilli bacterium]|nr:oligoendopeptidase F family protein [Bacilli bacterium]
MNKYKSRSDVPEKYKWDLSDFFKNNEEFDKELESVTKDLEVLKEYPGCTKDSNILFEFLNKLIELDNRIANLYVYSHLKNDEVLGVEENLSRFNKAYNLFGIFSNYTSFFSPELTSLSKEDYDKLFENKKLDTYKFMLDEIYKDKEHILPENEDKIVNDLLTSSGQYEDILSNLINSEHDYGTVMIDGEETIITSTNYRFLLKNKDSKVRKEVFNKFRGLRNQYAGTAASLLDSYVKTNNTIAKIHRFNNAWDSKLFGNHMPNEAYDALINTVESNTESVRRYIDLYKLTTGLKEVNEYDLNLDLADSDKKYTIEETQDLIREALRPLGDNYIEKYNRIIDNHYIDYCEYKGKQSGGYSSSSADHESRILLSFNEDLQSVSTIAHECGHNVHDQFIMANNPSHYVYVSTLVSEVASLTNECLLSNYLAINGTTKEEKLAGIGNMIDVILGNLFGTVREGKNEIDFNKYSNEGNTLTKEYLNKLCYDSLIKYYGDKVKFNENYCCEWVGRSHYFCDYYLFDYAFCVSVASANAMRILLGDKDALDRYIKFLSLGSDIYPIDAFKVLGFDLTNSKVYEEAIKYFNSLIDEFNKISKE